MADRPWRGARGYRADRGRGRAGANRAKDGGRGGSGRANGDQSNGRIPPTEDEQTLLAWTRQIPKAAAAGPLGRNRLSLFFQTAFTLISKHDAGITHQVINKLATEGGLYRISELVGIDLGVMADAERCSLFENMYWPFLQVITHKDALSSLILEKSMGDIYAYLYGVQGQRATKVFQSCVSTLEAKAKTQEPAESELGLHKWVTVVLSALAQLLECNQAASINDNLHPIVASLQICLDVECTSFKGTLLEQAASHFMLKIRRHIDHGTNIAPLLPTNTTTTSSMAIFELEIDGPGRLSTAGPRHDNDHADIKDIKILPTAQEIISPRAEYLPTKEPCNWHLAGIRGLIDQQFRLLREDTVGQLRDCVRTSMDDFHNSSSKASRKAAASQGLQVHKYSQVKFSDLVYDKRKRDLLVMAHFKQPHVLANRSAAERRRWWNESRQLHVDALICLVDSERNSLFFSIAEREGFQALQDNDKIGDNLATPLRKQTLWDDPSEATVTLRLIDLGNQNVVPILGRDPQNSKTHQVLVEFPGVLLPSFQPTLKALQRMSRSTDIPFTKLLVPPLGLQTEAEPVSWPPYTLQPGFAFDLSAIISDGDPLYLKRSEKFDLARLQKRSTLDETQCRALIGALSRELALVQGPPGTGKSFVAIQAMKVLLKNRQQAELNPIICVCYTNHALDQFLEHLVKDGTQKIIRIGSRSKSATIEPLNLRNVTKEMERTKDEKSTAWLLRSDLESQGSALMDLVRRLRYAGSQTSIMAYLQTENPAHHQQLQSLEDAEGFRTVGKKQEDNLTQWLNDPSARPSPGSANRPFQVLLQVALLSMSSTERRRVYGHWVSRIRQDTIYHLEESIQQYAETDQKLQACNQEISLRCLQQAHVIGVTTSGLACNIDLLRRVQPKVLLCEEAGEILEAHTLTAFLPSIQHAILIGDHEQLRPQVQNYELSLENPRGEKYSLDKSTFERLITEATSAVPYDTLQKQRRMHPSISELIRRTLYSNLLDDEIVRDYPAVTGMRKRLYWLDHRISEVGADPTKVLQMSQSNDYEVDLTCSLVSHLVRQGVYKSVDIVVLTPYVRQLQKIRNALGNSFEIVVSDRDTAELDRRGIADLPTNVSATHKAMLTQTLRIATVDNFQGEEANIVIVSLVRSNKESRCGFLRTTNRINVLLSRAKHGMYIIGNSITSSHVPMWTQVIDMLKQAGNIGPSLPLCCPQHPDTLIETWHVGIGVEGFALSVGKSRTETYRLTMAIVQIHVVELSARVVIPALQIVMETNLVRYAHFLALCNAVIRSVASNARNHVLRVQRHVPLDVRGTMVDYIMGLIYADINLDENPCIVPYCGHVMTLESMDGHMDLGEHYVMADDGTPLAPRDSSSTPLSVAIKGCPMCRGPLRNINRYNRAVKRALLDESTKKFIVWSNAQFVPLTKALQQQEEAINDAKEIILSADQVRATPDLILLIAGVRGDQIAEIRRLSGLTYRLGPMLALRKEISKFLHKVRGDEQPFARIGAMTAEIARKTGTTPTFTFDTGILQTRAHLLTTSLQLRCDYDILSDLLNVYQNHKPRESQTHPWLRKQLCFDLSENRRDCLDLVYQASQKQQPMIVIEAHLLFAKFVALERISPADSDHTTALVIDGRQQLESAKAQIEASPSTASMLSEVEEAEKMLREQTFYTAVTSAEKQAVYQAMAQDFRGTGHWYYCENMHPFTVGECGMPMQTSRCPQCGAAVGGQSHSSVEGVTRATDLDEQFGRLRV
ncbi:MAG: hypothetical protein Q9164_006026 [Protoblastenia rupestris]